MNPVTGRCFCGSVRFQFTEEPIARRACWCRDFQYLACGNGSINAIFRTETFELTGEVRDYVSTADSGSEMHRRFCPNCGTHLFSQAASRPELLVVRVGALDDPEIGRPAGHIWTASAPSWAHIDDTLPCSEGQPAPIQAR
jgi:hypothetical protein